MKFYVSRTHFHDWFEKNSPNNFSYEGREVLFDHIEQYEDDCKVEMEFDPIALRCEFGEMTLQEINDSYCHGGEDLFETVEEVEEFLLERTIYCGRTPQNTFVFQQF